MAFPQDPLDVRTDLLIAGGWQNVTADVFTRDVLTIVQGCPDEGTRADSGKASLTFNNGQSTVAPGVFGRYSQDNPRSDLYGQIGRNTGVRVHVPSATAHLALDGDPSGYVETPHTAALNITGDIDVRVEIDADMTDLTRNSCVIGKWGSTAADRSWMLRWYGGNFQFNWIDSGGNPLSIFIAARRVGGPALRAVLDVDNGAGGLTVGLYQADSLDGPWSTLYETTAAGTTSVQATTTPLRIGPGDPTTTPPRQPYIGTGTRYQVRSGINGTIVADADFRPLADAATSFTDSAGRTWTVNGTARVRKRLDLFVGEIPAWPPRWDVSGKDHWVPVEAAGVLRRIGRAGRPFESTLRRRIPSGNPDAYWPMEEGSAATQAASPVRGVAPAQLTGVQYASVDTLTGSSALPALGSLSTLAATVPPGSATGWHVEFVYYLAALPAVQQLFARVRVTGAGSVASAVVLVSSSGVRLETRDAEDATLSAFIFTVPEGLAQFAGSWNRMQIYTSFSGGTTTVHVSWRRTDGLATYWYTRVTNTVSPGRVAQVTGSWGASFSGMAIGHLAVWHGVSAALTAPYLSAISTYEGADDGFSGEGAGTRLLRLASEQGLGLSVRGLISDQEAVGAQRPGTFLALLGEAADADGGILAEHRGRLALRYRGRTTLYNQAPALTLDYTAQGEVAPPLEPMTDDAEVENDVTIERIDGSSGTAVLEVGALSVQAPPDGVGPYETSASLSLARDDRTELIANWRLHLGTWDAPRYPVVHVNLAAAPHLMDAALRVAEGDLIRITNPPPQLPPGTINLLVRGITKSVEQYGLDLYFTCVPADPWTVAGVAYWEDFEDTTYEITWTNGGTLPWARTNTQAHTGSWSMRSGAITHNQTSDMTVAVPPAQTELRFWYWTSSEVSGPGFLGDRLIVLVDGVQVLLAQGTTPWTQAIVDVTGKTSVTFRYAKDNSASAGSDFVAIDNVSFTGRAPVRPGSEGSKLASGVNATATSLSVAVTSGPLWITTGSYPAEFPFDIAVGGEVMRVTAITGASSPQTFTVQRSRNGVAKSQALDTPVQIAVLPPVAL